MVGINKAYGDEDMVPVQVKFKGSELRPFDDKLKGRQRATVIKRLMKDYVKGTITIAW